eukprot:GHVN01055738.1.p1 GENE.GHVN01055738.1~~GHVN01055738.1.p1  ORF type:complete len:1141 (+),score=73.99 GHVN01055738.1:3-3425(+)
MENLSVAQKRFNRSSSEIITQCKDGRFFFLLHKEDGILISEFPGQKRHFFPGQKAADRIASFHALSSSFYLIYETGDFFHLFQEKTVHVGSLEQRVVAASWCPSDNYLAILVKGGILLIMTKELEVVSERNINEEVVLERNSLGWGRVDTQYKGRSISHTSIDKSTMTDNISSLVWRFDSSLLAVSYWGNGCRQGRIYTRTGDFHCKIEDCQFFGSALSWKGCGNLLVSTSASQLVFFEKNGLSYLQTSLHGLEPPSKISWNGDSSFLATLHLSTAEYFLCIWNSSHYQWKIKQKIRNTKDFFWDTKDLSTIHCLQEGALMSVDLEYEHTTNRKGLALFTEDTRIGLTDFSKTCIPPPLFQRRICLEDFPIHQSLENEEPFLCFLFPEHISIFDIEGSELQRIHHSFKDPIRCLLTPNMVFVLESGERPTLVGIARRTGAVSFTVEIECASGLFYCNNTSAIVSTDTQIILIQEDGLVTVNLDSKGEGPVRWACTNKDGSFLILYKNQKLRHGNSIVLEECTGVVQGCNFFAATKSNNKIIIFAVENSLEKAIREIEFGARAFLLLEESSSIFLHMPRGSVEKIYPQSLVIFSIENLIAKKDFPSAFDLCRRHKIDYSTIPKLGGDSFLENIDSFLSSFSSAEKLNIFVSSLGMNAEKNIFEEKNILFEKIRDFCDRKGGFVETAITACVFSTPPQLERAAEYALKHNAMDYLVFLVKPESLLNSFLSLYNTEAALLAARKTQNDPREYIELLTRLEDENIFRKKFKIDDYLQKHEKALSSLLCCEDDVEVVVSYAKKHGLLPFLFEATTEKEKCARIMHEIAMDEKVQENPETYVSVLIAANNLDLALSISLDNLLWRSHLEIAALLGRQVAPETTQHLVNGLMGKGKHKDAYLLLVEVLRDTQRAFEVALAGKLWEEATFLYFRNPGLLQRPMLVHALSSEAESIEACLKEIQASAETIQTKLPNAYRRNEERILNFLKKLSEGPAEETASQFSTWTMNTQKSILSGLSRNPSKRIHRKTGSWHEPEALLEELGTLVEKANELFLAAKPLAYAFCSLQTPKALLSLKKAFRETRALLEEKKRLCHPKELPETIKQLSDKVLRFSPDVQAAITDYAIRIKKTSSAIKALADIRSFAPYL